MKALSFGEIVWDIYPQEAYIGGAPFNFAAHLACHGNEVYMASAVGADEWGKRTEAWLNRYHLHTETLSVRTDYPTGQCRVTLDERGIPAYDLLTDAAYDHIELPSIAEEFDCLYFGTLALRCADNRRTLQTLLNTHTFRYIVADVNIRPPFYSAETVNFALKNATLLKISEEDFALLSPIIGGDGMTRPADMLPFLAEKFGQLRCIVLTLGDGGAMAFERAGQKTVFVPAEKVTVCSTVGAGDALAAGFVHEYERTGDVTEALRHASRIAGYVVSRAEAVPPYSIEE